MQFWTGTLDGEIDKARNKRGLHDGSEGKVTATQAWQPECHRRNPGEQENRVLEVVLWHLHMWPHPHTHTTNKIIMNEMEFKNKGAKGRAHWWEPIGRALALASSQNYKERNTKGVWKKKTWGIIAFFIYLKLHIKHRCVCVHTCSLDEILPDG